MIKETIVVEGRDDECAVHQAVEARTIATHGYGVSKSTFQLIEKAYQETGIIIFTDPDYAGEQIRSRLEKRFPKAMHAYLPKCEAVKDGDIGIENASPEAIQQALSLVRCTQMEPVNTFSEEDLFEYGLSGAVGAAELRDRIGAVLGIGYGNSKVFLKRLNHYGVTREEMEAAWTSCTRQEQSEK